jgi:uncharacterized protein (DUF362 family)
MNQFNRRNFIRTTLAGGVAATIVSPLRGMPFADNYQEKSPVAGMPTVSLTTGDDRADIAFKALKPFSEQVKKAIGNKRVILKPNNVSSTIPLAATNSQHMEGVLEFLKSIGKLGNTIIAEAAREGTFMVAADNLGYTKVAAKYKVPLVDLDNEGYTVVYVFDEKDFRPHAVRMSNPLMDPNSYIISSAMLKTHDRACVTMSLKNIVLGAPIKDPGSYGKDRKKGAKADKPIVHGSGFRGMNYNLYALSSILHPHLSVIDGYQGMEGNGPIFGTPVDHKVCLASTNWYAADRVSVELMGVDFAKVGYLNFIADAGMGVSDLSKIQIIGEKIEDHKKTYKLNDNINEQLIWMQRVS